MTRLLDRLLTVLFAADETGGGTATMELPIDTTEGGRTPERKRFHVDVPFTKQVAPESGDLVLTGYASTWVQDRDLEFVLPSAFDTSLPDYMDKNPIILWQHNMDWPIGQMRKAEVDDYGLMVEGVVTKPTEKEPEWAHLAYEKVRRGIVKTFSIGGYFEREIRDRVLVITEVELFEVSVVSIPSNPDSIFEAAVKALKDEPGAKLTDRIMEQMAQVLGAKQLTDPWLASLTPEQRSEQYTGLAEFYKRAGCTPPDHDSWTKITARIDQGADPLAALKDVTDFWAQVRGAQLTDVKAGRVLSKANESKLRQATTKMQEALTEVTSVLSLVEDAPEVTDDGEVIDMEKGVPPADEQAVGAAADILAARRAAAARGERVPGTGSQ